MGNAPLDMDAFRAELWPTLKRIDPGTRSDFGGFGTQWFVLAVCRQWGSRKGDEVPNEFHVVAFEFLWDAVRLGLMAPTGMTPVNYTPFQNCMFRFTELGQTWREAATGEANPFADGFEKLLLVTAKILEGEPIALITEARRASRAGLTRATMFLLGLMNEDLLMTLFEAGIASGRVTSKASKKSPGKAHAMQSDVRDALQAAEGTVLAKGTANQWDAVVGTLRDYRNRCAHEAAYLPTTDEVYTALFMLPNLARLTQQAFDILSK